MATKTGVKSGRGSTKSMVTTPPPAIVPASASIGRNGKPSQEDIRVRAYQKWEAADRPEGDGVQFWLQAEQELQGGSI